MLEGMLLLLERGRVIMLKQSVARQDLAQTKKFLRQFLWDFSLGENRH
jgi:hypothetical protein